MRFRELDVPVAPVPAPHPRLESLLRQIIDLKGRQLGFVFA
ncbi:hypothetical protein [Sporisorium scitamineum]|uniref:Uncharacterized protein n=1 Tax=Sporisorium scitamineum TaxID=49012 RepID=A0A0F7RXB1_9BASI|nr:hypothetical protein [Sporisorium scitamineum]